MQAYYNIEPWGEERADLRSAVVASIIANCNRDPKTTPTPYTPAMFLLKFDREPEDADEDDEPQTVESQQSVATRLNNALNARKT